MIAHPQLSPRYNCDGTTYNGCGGHVYGESGTLDALDDDKCQWMIRVDDGYVVEISVITFDVSFLCMYVSANTLNQIPKVDCSVKLEMYEGSDATGGEIGKYCNDNTPGLITSQTRFPKVFLHFLFLARCTLTGTTLGPTGSRQRGKKLQVRLFEIADFI